MANLPVREMVLYKHGVGFFVRQGEVEGEKIALTFRQDEINDVLKSLAVFDQSGGQVLGIHYQTPMDKHARLASSSIKLSQKNSLRDLLRDLRGRDCQVVFEVTPGSQDMLTGRIIGIDEVQTQEEFSANVSILTASGVQIFPYETLRSIKIADEQSSHDLSYLLDTSMAEDDRRVVTVRLSEGEHDLAVYYVAPSPTWRVSYRLVAETDEDGSTGTALLQGWGLFDNRLEEDLDNVRVTLVAGQPISFIYELYASRIPHRPTVQDESRIAPGPIEFTGSRTIKKLDSIRTVDGAEISSLAEQIRQRINTGEANQEIMDQYGTSINDMDIAPPPSQPSPYRQLYDKPIEELDLSVRVFNSLKRTGITSVGDILDMLQRGSDAMLAIRGVGEDALDEIESAIRLERASSAASQAEGSATGETFQYAVTSPVSVKRGDSALVPILNEKFSYNRELLYNKDKFPNHPVASLRFDNTTGLTLERGPVTVVENGNYTGEAVIPFTKENNEVFVPYAVELGVKIGEADLHATETYSLSIENHFLYENQYQAVTTTYVINNTTSQTKRITIEANIRANWQLYETPDPDVELINERRWHVDVDAHSKVEFVRKERQATRISHTIRNLGFESLARYLKKQWLDENTYKAIYAILKTVDANKQSRDLIRESERERHTIYNQQEQIRANLGALQPTGQEANLRNRLLKQLESTQDRLDAIELGINEAKQAIEDGEKQIQSLLNSLE